MTELHWVCGGWTNWVVVAYAWNEIVVVVLVVPMQREQVRVAVHERVGLG